MQYQSTRNKNISVDSAVAIKTGLSSDGGLFVPESIPSVTIEDLQKIAVEYENELREYRLTGDLNWLLPVINCARNS
jgi:threonine synthase